MRATPDETPPVMVERDRLAELLARLCPPAAIDLAGAVSLPCSLPHAEHWHAYLKSGRHADLEYLARDPAGRLDPTLARPWASSLLVFAQRYGDGWDPGDPGGRGGYRPGAPWTDGVARYARGLDYHDVLLRAIKEVIGGLAEALPGLRAQAATDTGPYLEREYAWLAGLGFLGKNSCLIHEELGSALLLGVAATNLNIAELPPAGTPAREALYAVAPRPTSSAARDRARRPQRNRGTATVTASATATATGAAAATVTANDTTRCGRCTACLDACPTGALIAPFTLDGNRCISTWTIEWLGRPPDEQRHLQSSWLFGCDICQAVCPWNGKAFRRAQASSRDLARPPAAYAVLASHDEVTLADLTVINDEEFRRRFRRTPLWRCHPEGMRRNAAAVAAGSRQDEAVHDDGPTPVPRSTSEPGPEGES